MRTTLNLPDALIDAAKQRAAQESRTLTSVIEEALRNALAQPRPTAAVRLPAYGTGRGQVLVDLDDRAALAEALDGE